MTQKVNVYKAKTKNTRFNLENTTSFIKKLKKRSMLYLVSVKSN